MGNYKDLNIYTSAFDLSIEVHGFSLKLPSFELYEQGSQLRRSSKSIKDNIAEGYGRKRYKSDFIKFLVYAHSSCDETINHLETIQKLYPDLKASAYISQYDQLGRQINKFIQYVEDKWNTKNNTVHETEFEYGINKLNPKLVTRNS